MAINAEQKNWALNLINPDIYPDIVEQVIDYKEDGPNIYVIAIDTGNPPIVPLKQLIFKFTYADDSYEDLTSYEFKLLNPDEVANGATRPAAFSAHLPIDAWDNITSDLFWEDGDDCEDCTPDPDEL
jgi:hypothetical protein